MLNIRPDNMRFLSVAERELRAAARKPATHRARWITSALFLLYLFWLFWAMDGFTRKGTVPDIFDVFATTILFYCLIVGAARTADCISAERREGTLGLLFLTNLNSAEIVAGKLCSSALGTVYNLIAVFPMLALPLLMGGITFSEFWKIILGLVNALFFSLACGFAASVVSARQFTSVALALALSLLGGAGLLGAAAIMDEYNGNMIVIQSLATCCPLYAIISADGSRPFVQNHYWLSILLVAFISISLLLLVAMRLARSWRDQPKSARGRFFRLPQGWRDRTSAGLIAMRRRLLDINPFYWLAGRNRISSPIYMALVVLMFYLAAHVVAPAFSANMWPRPKRGEITLEGFCLAWMFLCMGLHAITLYYAAMISSQRLAEDKHAGALELVLCTPTTERTILRGLWRAFARRMLFPAVACTFAHLFLIWAGATMLTFEVSFLKGLNTGELIWRAFWGMTITNRSDDWSFAMVLRIFLLALVIGWMLWITLANVGRWLGLRMKHPGFAPILSLVLVAVPPTLVFSFVCFVLAQARFFRASDKIIVPTMTWTLFGIVALNCLVLCLWAAGRLRNDFRATVTSRFQPPSSGRWWLPRKRTVIRLAVGIPAIALVVALAVAGFYARQNSRARAEWKSFQAAAEKRNQPLTYTALLPPAISDKENFYDSKPFKMASTADPELKRILDATSQFSSLNGNTWLNEWMNKPPTATHLLSFANSFVSGFSKRGRSTNNADVIAPLLNQFTKIETPLRTLAEAGERATQFQSPPPRDATTFLSANAENERLLRLQMLFVVRACVLLNTNRAEEAGADVMTALRLAELSGGAVDPQTSQRQQAMTRRALQPLWEGIKDRRWNEAQLAAFQSRLERLDLFGPFTNNVRRIVNAHIDLWRVIPDSGDTRGRSVREASGNYIHDDSWLWQPREWWLDRCQRLHEAGERCIGKIDPVGRRVDAHYDWLDINDLPIGQQSSELLQQYPWYNGNVIVAISQNSLHQAVIACALERYRIAHGNYPRSLTELTPGLLSRIPTDIARGSPMLYETTTNCLYTLRSVGPDGQDDRKSKNSDDWLWWYGTNAPPASAR